MAKLLDQFGKPMDKGLLKSEIATPTLTGVRQVVSGIASGLTPERLAYMLRAAETGYATSYLALAEEMEEKFLHYGAELATRKRALLGVDLELEAAGDDAESLADVELLKPLIPLIRSVLFDLLDAIGKGFSVSEVIWDTSEGQWMPSLLLSKPAHWFQYDRTDGVTLRMRDDSNPDGLLLQPNKFIEHRSAAKSGLPIRGGLARGASWAYLFSNFAMKDWVTFIEVFGQPLRLGRYEVGTSSEDIEVLIEAVRGLGTDAAAVVPKSMDLDFKESSGKSASADIYERLLDKLEGQISKMVLGQTLSTNGGKGSGSYALGTVHNDVRYDILESDAEQLENTLQQQLIIPCINFNRGARKLYPTLKFQLKKPEDMTSLANNIKTLSDAGLEIPTDWVYKKFGMPVPKDGQAIIGGKAATAPAPVAMRSAHTVSVITDPADHLTASLADQGGDQLGNLVDQIKQLVESATSLEALRTSLLSGFGGLDASALQQVMTMAFACAELSGRFEVTSE